jgi:hypothetical protein
MLYITCFVRFTSLLELNEVAKLISEELFGGLPFIPTEEFDEVPGVRLTRPILMLDIRIQGSSPHYGLRIDPNPQLFLKPVFPKLESVILNPYIEEILSSFKEICIIPT